MCLPLRMSAEISLTPGEITIIASTPVPEHLDPNEKMLSDVNDCGFNAIFYNVGSENTLNKVLASLVNLNLKLIPSSKLLKSDKSKSFVKTYRNKKEIVAWNFVDEPQYKDLPQLKEFYQGILNTDQKRPILVNLVGVFNQKYSGDSPDYISYMDTIKKIFNPLIWSFDTYPIVRYKDKDKFIVEYDPFYFNLECFSKFTRKLNSSFMTYSQSLSVVFNNGNVFPEAKASYLRFEAFSSLAYGAQGIVYWTYGQRESNTKEHYTSALIDLNGKKYPAWYSAREVNQEIKAYNRVFYKSRLIDCRHTGDNVYRGTRKLVGAFGPITHITSGGKGVLASLLQTDGRNYLIIVSHDPFGFQNVRLKFDSKYKVKELKTKKKDNIKVLDIVEVNGLIKRKLDAGGYAIFEWE